MLGNIVMLVFNLLPIFPMDGGRVLRALLSMAMPRARATNIAAGIGKFFAILLGLTALYFGQYLLLITCVFVWIGATREAEDVEHVAHLRQFTASQALIGSYCALQPTDTLEMAYRKLLGGFQMDFPVLDASGRVIGILHRQHLARRVLAPEMLAEPVSTLTLPPLFVFPETPLDTVVRLFQQHRCPLICVQDEYGALLGLVTPETIQKFLLVVRATF
jgi:stage IV sporulation protein FB